jgi:hypothetical protein
MTLNLCALPLGARLRTRDGRSARLLATDLRGAYRCVVAIDCGSYEDIDRVGSDGRSFVYAEKNIDIVAVEESTDA